MFLINLLVLGCILLYILLNLYIYLMRIKYKHFKSPPVPISPIWFLGALPEFMEYAKRSEKLVLYAFYDTYGWDVFVIHLFTRNMIFCLDLSVISKVCNDRVMFPKNKMFHDVLKSVAGIRIFGEYGLLNDTGTDVWHAKRRVMEPAFHKGFLRTIMTDLNIVVENLMSRLREKDSHTFDITEEFCRAAFESISVCGFNWNQELLEKHGEQSLKLASTMVKVITLSFKEYATFNFPWSRREEKRELRKNMPRMRDVARTHLLDRLENTNEDKEDILSHLIRSIQCSDQLTLEDLVDEYLTFIGAGMETTAITMAITLFYLSVYPEVYKKVQQEIDEVFEDTDDLSFDDLNKMVFLEMVIKECMRLKPPVMATTRKCNKDKVVINDIYIPEGAVVIVPIDALHKDPRYWENPHEFNPERFAPEAKRNITRFTYMPFMLGQRTCIGQHFAMLEMKIVIAKIVREFVVENPKPEVKYIETVGNITARPSDGVTVRLLSRM
ncbi:cholesterol 24-hydroxylase-like [Bolinopsis microptera]|uniref:cholesterol 24-hydroxylase-like n=1 Tax=Bolinopsis microptera TaxID=2820187 RepID=UPI00307A3C1B